jgi:anti-sigma B factor antagonist
MVSAISKSTTPFAVVAGPAPHTTTLVLDGDLDLACADRLRSELDKQLLSGRKHIRVDAARVQFLDGTVLGVLFEAHSRLLARGGTLVLTGTPARVQRLLGLTGLDRVLFRTDPSTRRRRVPRSPGNASVRRPRPDRPTS